MVDVEEEAALPLEGGCAAAEQKREGGGEEEGMREHIPEMSTNRHVGRSTVKFYSITPGT